MYFSQSKTLTLYIASMVDRNTRNEYSFKKSVREKLLNCLIIFFVLKKNNFSEPKHGQNNQKRRGIIGKKWKALFNTAILHSMYLSYTCASVCFHFMLPPNIKKILHRITCRIATKKPSKF